MVEQAENKAQYAWDAAVSNLQSDMSRNNFETYVSPTRLIDFKDGTFIIGCENDYSRDWIEGRLASTLVRSLTGLMNSAVKVSFVVAEAEPDQSESDSDAPDNAPGSDALTVSIRDKLIAPQRVVKFPIYILRWLQYIPAQILFVVMALWQEHYLASRGKSCRGNPVVSVRAEQVCQWAGISRATFFRLFEPGSGIYWFLDKTETKHEQDGRTGRMKKSSNLYTLFDMPMTPGDAEVLRAYLREHGIAETPAVALQTAIEAGPKGILKFPVRLPSKDFDVTRPQNLTVQQIVRELVGHELDPELLELAEALTDRLLARGEFFLVSWYFLRNWLPLLGADAAMFILVLRSLCYFNDQTGEIRDTVWIEGGFVELAQRLGILAWRTVANWFSPRIDRGKRQDTYVDGTRREYSRRKRFQALLNLFVERTDFRMGKSGNYAWEFRVRRADPLTPKDEAVMLAIGRFIESAKASRILDEAKDWIETVKREPKVVLRLSNLTNGCSETLKNALNDCFETLELDGNDWFETLFKTLKSLKDSIQEEDTSTDQDSSTLPETNRAVEGVTDSSGNWSLEKLLAKVASKKLETLLTQETDALAFVSWVIYGASQPGIRTPIGLAYDKLNANPGIRAGGACGRLAALPPRRLAELIEQGLSYFPPSDRDWQKAFSKVDPERISKLAEWLGIDLPAQ